MIEIESRKVTWAEIQRIHKCDESPTPVFILLKDDRDGFRVVVGSEMAVSWRFWFCPYCRCDLGDLKNSEVYNESL